MMNRIHGLHITSRFGLAVLGSISVYLQPYTIEHLSFARREAYRLPRCLKRCLMAGSDRKSLAASAGRDGWKKSAMLQPSLIVLPKSMNPITLSNPKTPSINICFHKSGSSALPTGHHAKKKKQFAQMPRRIHAKL
jgi:hypothetical protein